MKLEKRIRRVFDLDMAYVETGSGDPIVFLHGNPTSSFLWRNVMPHVAHIGRCIAPDLIGMGDFAKLPDSGPGAYRFVQHRRYLDELLRLLGVNERVTLVVHDWGSALGFDWAVRHPDSVAGLAYMEAIVTPLTWADWPEVARGAFRGMRSEAGEEMVLRKNFFVERILAASIMRDLTGDEMEEYRRPFLRPGEDRRPTLTWPREIPIEGSPADVHEVVESYSARRRSRLHPGGPSPGGVPVMAQPDRGHRAGLPLPPGGFSRRDRRRPRRLAGSPGVTDAPSTTGATGRLRPHG